MSSTEGKNIYELVKKLPESANNAFYQRVDKMLMAETILDEKSDKTKYDAANFIKLGDHPDVKPSIKYKIEKFEIPYLKTYDSKYELGDVGDALAGDVSLNTVNSDLEKRRLRAVNVRDPVATVAVANLNYLLKADDRLMTTIFTPLKTPLSEIEKAKVPLKVIFDKIVGDQDTKNAIFAMVYWYYVRFPLVNNVSTEKLRKVYTDKAVAKLTSLISSSEIDDVNNATTGNPGDGIIDIHGTTKNKLTHTILAEILCHVPLTWHFLCVAADKPNAGGTGVEDHLKLMGFKNQTHYGDPAAKTNNHYIKALAVGAEDCEHLNSFPNMGLDVKSNAGTNKSTDAKGYTGYYDAELDTLYFDKLLHEDTQKDIFMKKVMDQVFVLCYTSGYHKGVDYCKKAMTDCQGLDFSNFKNIVTLINELRTDPIKEKGGLYQLDNTTHSNSDKCKRTLDVNDVTIASGNMSYISYLRHALGMSKYFPGKDVSDIGDLPNFTKHNYPANYKSYSKKGFELKPYPTPDLKLSHDYDADKAFTTPKHQKILELIGGGSDDQSVLRSFYELLGGANGKEITKGELARLAGFPPAQIDKLLTMLEKEDPGDRHQAFAELADQFLPVPDHPKIYLPTPMVTTFYKAISLWLLNRDKGNTAPVNVNTDLKSIEDRIKAHYSDVSKVQKLITNLRKIVNIGITSAGATVTGTKDGKPTGKDDIYDMIQVYNRRKIYGDSAMHSAKYTTDAGKAAQLVDIILRPGHVDLLKRNTLQSLMNYSLPTASIFFNQLRTTYLMHGGEANSNLLFSRTGLGNGLTNARMINKIIHFILNRMKQNNVGLNKEAEEAVLKALRSGQSHSNEILKIARNLYGLMGIMKDDGVRIGDITFDQLKSKESGKYHTQLIEHYKKLIAGQSGLQSYFTSAFGMWDVLKENWDPKDLAKILTNGDKA